MAANQRPELAVVILLVLYHVIENGEGALVAQRLELLTVVGYVAALLDFKPAQRHADAASAVGQGICLAVGVASIDRLRTAELDDPALP